MDNALGFAVRRDVLCDSGTGEVDCGPTWGDYRACCPHGAYCPSTRDPDYYNAECCDEPNVNCTQTIIDEGPFCANESWGMFTNGGYFCCPPGLTGYSHGIGDGCANESTYTVQSGEAWLGPSIAQKAKPSQTSSESSSSSSHSSSLSGGAIAGIVVGCVAGVTIAALAVWFLLRQARQRKRATSSEDKREDAKELPSHTVSESQTTGQPDPEEPTPAQNPPEYPPEKQRPPPEPVELPADSKPMEVPGSPVHPTAFNAEKPG